MKKNAVCILFLLLILCGCNQISNGTANEMDSIAQTTAQKTIPKSSSKDTSQKQTVPDFNVAPKFISKYVQAIVGPHGGPAAWVQHSSLLTENFKNEYRRISKSEESLCADVVLDANILPGSGFTILQADTLSGYVTIAGKGQWKDYQLVLKLALQEDNWLVDGAGMINIPEERRVRR